MSIQYAKLNRLFQPHDKRKYLYNITLNLGLCIFLRLIFKSIKGVLIKSIKNYKKILFGEYGILHFLFPCLTLERPRKEEK